MVEKHFNSKAGDAPLELQAPYYNAIEPTQVFFDVEGISATADSLGHMEFYDAEGTSLGFVDVPAAESPDLYAHSGQYGTMRCEADGETITFHLPVYDWEDSYPHCDGESDRWTRRTKRWFRVVFDCKSQRVQVLDR